jgi:hypothetical protein
LGCWIDSKILATISKTLKTCDVMDFIYDGYLT